VEEGEEEEEKEKIKRGYCHVDGTVTKEIMW
jgi:hypothetical protein